MNASVNEPILRRALPPVDGRLVSVAGAALALAFVLLARISPATFVALAVVGLGLVAYAAHRWPLRSLVAAAIATLVDLEILRRLLPEGIDLGPIGLSEPMLAVAGLVVTVDAARRGTLHGALRDPVLPLVGLFVALAVASAFVNATPPLVALLGIVMTVEAIALYFVVRMVPLDERVGAVAIGSVLAAAVAVSVFGIAQVLLDPNLLGFASFQGTYGEGGRITSFLGNPNMVSALVGLAVPFALYGSVRPERASWRWAARATLFLLVLALLLSFSRGAWLAVGLGGLVGALLLDWRALVALAVALALAWGTATYMPRSLLVQSAGEAAPPPSFVDSTADRIGHLRNERDTRAKFVRDGIPIILDNLLLGVGPGRYGGAAAAIIPSPVYEEYHTSLFGYRTVHNFWQHLLGESGALGTAVFLVMLLGLLIRFVRGARAATGVRFVIVAGAATTILVAGIHSITEMIFEGNMPVLIAWLVIGIASTMAPSLPLFARADSS